MKNLKILSEKLLPMLFWILLMLAFDTPAITFATLLAAAIHELGHIAVMGIITRGSLPLPKTVISGLRLRPHRLLSYGEEMFLALGGPLANIVVFLLLIPLFDRGGGYFLTFAILNLLTAASNLIPIRGYDGYRIIRNLLIPRLGGDRADSVMQRASTFFCGVAVFLSLFLILKIGEGYWIFAIFFGILVKDVLKMQRISNSENKRDFKSI